MNMNPVDVRQPAPPCCKLCVTTTMQYFSRSACRVSSTRRVEIGSSAAGRLVEQQNFGLHRDGPVRCNKRLLLAARQTPARRRAACP